VVEPVSIRDPLPQPPVHLPPIGNKKNNGH
jgi:hypothetical protein